MRALLVAAAGCGVFGVVSCTLVAPLDGLTGGALTSPDAGVATDAGVAADVGVPVDAADDGSAPTDGGAVADVAVGSDAQSAADGAPEASVLFSDDFEGPPALPRSWDQMSMVGGSLGLANAIYRSPDTSLQASALPVASTAPGNAVDLTLTKSLPMPAPGSTTVFDFHAYLQQYDTAANVAVVGKIQLVDAAGDLYELQVDAFLPTANAGALSVTFAEYTGLVDGGSQYIGHPSSGTLTPNTWNDIQVELTYSQPPLARVYINGALAVETTIEPTIVGTAAQISLGLSYVQPGSAAWNVYYDDVSYDVEP